MVRDKKPLLRKFDRSARTGELYDNKSHANDIAEHNKEVTAKLERLREENVGKDVEFFEPRPNPDIIQIDWEKKEITTWELSKINQLSKKERSYKNHERWANHVILTQTEKGKEKTPRYLWRRVRYRRITQGSNKHSKEVIIRDGNKEINV